MGFLTWSRLFKYSAVILLFLIVISIIIIIFTGADSVIDTLKPGIR